MNRVILGSVSPNLSEVVRRTVRIGAALALAAGLAAPGARAQETSGAVEAPIVLAPEGNGPVGNVIQMDVGRSKALKTPFRIKRVSVANPDIADVEALEPTEILLVSKLVGSTDMIIWGEEGQVWSAEILVDIKLDRLNDDLARLFPASSLNVTRSNDVYFITGLLERAEHAQRLQDFFSTAELKYVDMTRVAGLQQVQLQVRVAEVSRTAIKRMGVNALYGDDSFFGASTIGSATGGVLNPISIGPLAGDSALGNIPFVFTDAVAVNPFVTLLAGFPGSDLEFFIQALAENQYLRLLAEPTLVALSGEEASFLAGGEFPIPVVQGTITGGNTSITIEYKEFGVRLRFRPVVLGDGSIRLHLAPEVSDLSDVGAVEIQGFRIPSLLTRRAETTLELSSGQTFMMAGLLNQAVSARNSRVPLLGDIPILGNLFRSTSYQHGESELVILVTATLVEPHHQMADMPIPGDLYVAPTDWELFLFGHVQGGVLQGDRADDQSSELDMEGLEDLRGPGAWASHYEEPREQTAATTPSNLPTIQMQTTEEIQNVPETQ